MQQRLSQFVLAFALIAATAGAQVYIQEFCTDPFNNVAAIGLDTNLDGVAATSALQSDDEFVEFVNAGASAVDISGWTFSDGTGPRHVFTTGSSLPAGCAVVVFGGGDVTAFNAAGIALGVVASTGALGLGNTGDTFLLTDDMGSIVTMYISGSGTPDDGDGESVTRSPEGPGGTFVMHTTISAATHSAGSLNDATTPYCPGTTLTAAYPGNPSDLALEILIGGALDAQPSNIHDVVGGDLVAFRFLSPLGGLDFQPFAVAFQLYNTPFPINPIQLPGDAAPSIWITPVLPIATYESITTQGLILNPQIVPGGFNLGPVVIPVALSGMLRSVMVQLFAIDPGINLINIGASDAHELRIQ